MPSNWAPTTSRGRARPQENDNVNHVVALSRNIYSILFYSSEEVARTIIPSNFPVELQLQFVLWDPLGPSRGVLRGVPEGSRGSQRDPEEE